MEAGPATKRSWIGWSLLSGCVVGVPAGCLLAYLAVLPLFVGLFFFLLVGLVIGAVMFRFGKPAAPVRPATLRQISAAVTVLVWATGLVVEYVEFPDDAARAVRRSLPQRLTLEQQDELRDNTRRHVLSQLTGRDFQGGFVGYLRGFPSYLKWAATQGTMECPRVFNDSMHTLKLPQRGIPWLIRVLVSLGLLAFPILSQLRVLANPPEPPDRKVEPAEPPSAE